MITTEEEARKIYQAGWIEGRNSVFHLLEKFIKNQTGVAYSVTVTISGEEKDKWEFIK